MKSKRTDLLEKNRRDVKKILLSKPLFTIICQNFNKKVFSSYLREREMLRNCSFQDEEPDGPDYVASGSVSEECFEKMAVSSTFQIIRKRHRFLKMRDF